MNYTFIQTKERTMLDHNQTQKLVEHYNLTCKYFDFAYLLIEEFENEDGKLFYDLSLELCKINIIDSFTIQLETDDYKVILNSFQTWKSSLLQTISKLNNKIYPYSCGLTFENRPTISFKAIPEFNNNLPFTLWYHTTFFRKDDALDFIKEVFKEGLTFDDIGRSSKNGFWLRMDEVE